jgi:hypothetical protein
VEGDANVVLNRFPLPVIGLAVAALGLAACTAATPTTTPSTGTATATTTSQTKPASPADSPTPSPTLDADQAAAVGVVERYSDAMAKVRADPAKYGQYKMIEVLKPLAFDDMIQANLNGMRTWRNNGWHAEGDVVTVSTSAGEATQIADGSTRVAVTVCRDQRGLEVVDKTGKQVTAKAAQFPDFLQNTYDMRRPTAGTFKLWELAGKAVEGCAS